MISRTMANCPIAMNIDVEGYMAMILAPTLIKLVSIHIIQKRKTIIHTGTKGQIAKECDDLIYHDGTTNGSPDNDIHALLRVRLQFVEDREQLSHLLSKLLLCRGNSYILGTRERKYLHRERRDEVWCEMDEMDFASWSCAF